MAGLQAAPPEVREAADGMGFRAAGRLWSVELPLALPLMIAGLRVATVSTIGLVTITATLGDALGGLGFFIYEGMNRYFTTEILVGAVPTILLSLLADRAFVWLQAWVTPWARRGIADRGGGVTFVEETIAWLTDPAHWSGPDGIPGRLVEHVEMSLVVMLIATAIALPIGLFIGHTRRGTTVAVGLANIGRAIPTFAMMGILLPFTQALDPANGFGLYPTLLAMIILAIPPILVNTYAGVSEVDRDLVEAARGMGFRGGQTLRDIEIPLAVPVIVGGIRSAAVQVIATTTLGAILGIGGLGRFIVDGIAQNDDGMLFGGVVLVASLAMLSELLLSRLQRLSYASARARPTPPAFIQRAAAPRPPATI